MSSLFQIGLREYAYSIFRKIPVRTYANVFYFSVVKVLDAHQYFVI